MLFVVFVLWYFTNQSRVNKKELLAVKTAQLDSLNIKLDKSTARYWAMYESKQKTDTIIKIIKGVDRFIYRDVPIKVEDTIKTLNDSLESDYLKLRWQISHSGEIYSFIPEWDVEQRTITVENIVKVPAPYPVEKLVLVNKRALYIGAMVSYPDVQPYINATYLDKKKGLYSFSYAPIDRSFLVGYSFKLF